MKRIIYIMFCVSLFGCNYLDDYSQDLVIAKSVADVDELLLGSAYLRYGSPEYLSNGDVGFWIHLLDDDVNGVIATNARASNVEALRGTYYGYFTWQWEVGRNYDKSNLASDANLWNTLYSHINIANIILAEIENMDRHNEQEELDAWRVQGEAHFLRAQFYLFLVNIYGDAYAPSTAENKLGVPLKLTEYVEHDPDKNPQFERASVQEVYQQIVQDLEEAVNCFERGSQPLSIYRASKEAALLLLSRVYLYMQDWENARDRALEVLETKNTLTSVPFADSTVFLTPTSLEIIFTQGVQNLKHAISGWGGEFCVSRELYDLYDDTDRRKTVYFTTSRDSVGLYYKYDPTSEPSYLGDIFMLRTAEAYLNAAEAYAMLGDAGNASTYLNDLRRMRHNSYSSVTYGADEIIQEVRNERRRELCFEGHRWFDLRRYAVCENASYKRTIDHVFPLYNTNDRNAFQSAEVYRLEIDDPAYTFAIPKDVLTFDSEMPDNPREVREYIETITIDDDEEETEEPSI